MVTIFGLRNALENSLIQMTDALNSIDGAHRFMVSYVDDICIYHDNLADHLFDVERVLQKLADCNLKLKPATVAIAMNTCDIFGFRLNSRGFTVSPTKKSAILKIPPPKTKKELETILGKASYYRNLLPPSRGMGYFTNAFRDIRGNGPFKFTESHHKAFQELKQAMHEFTLLQRLLPSDQHLIVRSDASHSHWAGSLAAVRNGKEIPIFHVSKAFAGPALRYAICRKELVAALMTLYEFRTDLYGRKKVELHTDNASTFYLLSNPEKVKVDSQVLQHMFYNVRYLTFTPVRVSGKDPDWALIDRLSRSQKPLKISSQNVQQLLQIDDDPMPEDLVCVADMRPINTELDGLLITAPLFDLKVLKLVKEEIQNNPEYQRDNVVPEHLKDVLLRALHQVGHKGPVRMAAILTSNGIVWKNRNSQIEKIVRQCTACSTRKPQSRQINEVPNIIDVLEPKNCVAIDVSTVGQPAVFHTLVMIDVFTHYITARRIPGKLTYMNIANTVLTMLAAYAPTCQTIRLDNASYYSKDFQNFLAGLGIRCSFVSRMNSRGSGLVERAIQSVSRRFACMIDEYPQLNSFKPMEIDLVLETICLHINMTHKVQGVTPYALNYGRNVIFNEKELPNIVSSNLNIYEKRLTDRIKSLIEPSCPTVCTLQRIVSVAMSLEMKLSSMDINETVQSCQAASSESFKGSLASAMTKFQNQIKSDLSEYIDFEAGPGIPEKVQVTNDDNNAVTVADVKANPLLCDRRDVTCSFMPVIKPLPVENTEEVDVGLQACYNSNLGTKPALCNIAGGLGICCSKHISRNEGKCPTKNIREVLRIISRVERKFPERLHKLRSSMMNVETRRIQNYCIALTAISLKGVETKVGGYAMNGKTVADLGLDTEEGVPDWWPHDRSLGRKRRGTSRNRRSNWAYYTSGGFWTSTYIDQQVNNVKKAAEADASELREAVQKNSKMLLTIEADMKERQQLRGAVCGVTEDITEKIIFDELQNAQFKLEFKSEFVLRSCSSGEVPDAVSSEVLEKLCTAASNSPHCYGAGVRALFRCRLNKPLITMEMIGITMSLTMGIPI